MTSAVAVATTRGVATVEVEVARTPEEIQRGLMYRRYLAPDAGMLFVMGRSDVWAFYMRNTLIPLDMIYIGDDLRIVGIVHDVEPCTETHRGVGLPSFFVLEVNGGWARRCGAEAGGPCSSSGCTEVGSSSWTSRGGHFSRA